MVIRISNLYTDQLLSGGILNRMSLRIVEMASGRLLNETTACILRCCTLCIACVHDLMRFSSTGIPGPDEETKGIRRWGDKEAES